MKKLNFTKRAKRYVQQSPQCKMLIPHQKDKLIRGIAKLMSEAYKQGHQKGLFAFTED